MKPFNLEAALAGELVQLRRGDVARVLFVKPDLPHVHCHVIGYLCESGSTTSWTKDGKASAWVENHNNDIIGMYEEPAPDVTITFKQPLKELRDDAVYSHINENREWNISSIKNASNPDIILKSGRVFAIKEDVQKFIYVMEWLKKWNS